MWGGWTELSPHCSGCTFVSHSARRGHCGLDRWGQSRTLTPCCASSSSSSPSLGSKRTVLGGAVQECCFPLWWCEIPHVRGPAVQWEGWNTQPVWKCGCLCLNIVFKHGWIFIHVAETGLPCKCILKVFHLPNPSCTSDNLQYYFFC